MIDGRLRNHTFLSLLIILMLSGLGLMIFTSDRSISRMMESCGEFISQALGF